MSENVENKANQLSELIVQDFNFDSENSLLNTLHIDELRENLEKIVAYLLDNDFERLLNAMYRLDIDEKKFKTALSGLGNKPVSKEITDLIINREIQKLKTRLKYRVGR